MKSTTNTSPYFDKIDVLVTHAGVYLTLSTLFYRICIKYVTCPPQPCLSAGMARKLQNAFL